MKEFDAIGGTTSEVPRRVDILREVRAPGGSGGPSFDKVKPSLMRLSIEEGSGGAADWSGLGITSTLGRSKSRAVE